jgi:hypothetical protein
LHIWLIWTEFWCNFLSKILSNDIICSDSNKVILVLLENLIKRILQKVSAAYLQLLLSLLNSNQRENLILKMNKFSDHYNIVIILTNVD